MKRDWNGILMVGALASIAIVMAGHAAFRMWRSTHRTECDVIEDAIVQQRYPTVSSYVPTAALCFAPPDENFRTGCTLIEACHAEARR